MDISFSMDQILPGNRELLPIVQEKGWTKLLLGWLNQHDRPAVQVEALLALTSIADMFQQNPAINTCGNEPVYAAAAAAGQNAPIAAQMSNAMGVAGVAGVASVSGMNMNTTMDSAMNSVSQQQQHQQQQHQQQQHQQQQHQQQQQQQQQQRAAGGGESIPNNNNSSAQYNPYGYSYLPWNYDPSQPNSIPPQMMNDPAVQAAINGGYLQNLLNSCPSGPGSAGPMPPQPSSFANSGVPNASHMMGNYTQPMSQSFLLNNAEAIPTLISLLSSPNREVHEHAMWMLGNIAVAPSNSGTNSSLGSMNDPNDKIHSVSPKEALLSAGVMTPLLHCLEKNPLNLTLQRIGSWAISNLVETKMQHGKSGKTTIDGGPIEFDIGLLIPSLKRLLDATDHEILNYTCWSLSHLCDGPASHISAVVTSKNPKDPPCGLVPRLVQLLHHENWRLVS